MKKAETPAPVRIAIFASGNGSNAEAIATSFAHHEAGRVVLICTDNPGAGVIARAARLDLPVCVMNRSSWRSADALDTLLKAYSVDLVVLAGYLRLVPAGLTQRYAQRIVNIHPALLPAFGGKGMYGMNVHEAVIASGAAESGITIHYVNERYDEGEHIFQARLKVMPGWTPDELRMAIHALEHRHFPEIITQLCRNLQAQRAPAFESDPIVAHWRQELEKNGVVVHSLKEAYARRRKDGSLLFAVAEADADLPEGGKLPPVCFVKGAVVSVLINLIDETSGSEQYLLVRQRRVCHGGWVYEMPAGMIEAEDSPAETALREVQEETGLAIAPEALIALNLQPFYSSAGFTDEAAYFFACELRLPAAEIGQYGGQQHGMAHEHEHIVTALHSPEAAKALVSNALGRLNIALYENWKAGSLIVP